MKKHWIATLWVLFVAAPGVASGAPRSFEALEKNSVRIYDVKGILRPFVATCGDRKTRFRRLFCEALNERLKAQHQERIYHVTRDASGSGPLTVEFRARPKPAMKIRVRGCLTCDKPMLDREGGDIARSRFFLFKLPDTIRIQRRAGKSPYDLGNIDVATYTVALPEEMTREKFEQEVLPQLRLDMLFRPVAGVTQLGGRHKFGVINFELVGHRVLHKCEGKVYGASPAMASKYVVDKNDLSCPQNQPKIASKTPQLPSTLPQKQVKWLMEVVGQDLRACYEQFGVGGDVPTDLVVAPDGRVKHVKVIGALADSPTGACVERLVRNVTFPKFAGRDARLQWPFSLTD